MNVREARAKLDRIYKIRAFLDELSCTDWVIEDNCIVTETGSVSINEIAHLLGELAYLIEEMKVTK